MLTIANPRQFAKEAFPALFALVLLSIGIGVGIYSVVGSQPSKRTAACDEAVHQVLTTKDPVELQRNIFLVRWLDCSVSSRLP